MQWIDSFFSAYKLLNMQFIDSVTIPFVVDKSVIWYIYFLSTRNMDDLQKYIRQLVDTSIPLIYIWIVQIKYLLRNKNETSIWIWISNSI